MPWIQRSRRSGVRDITDALERLESGCLLIQRDGNTVTLSSSSLHVDHTGSALMATIPSGFRPATNLQTTIVAGGNRYLDLYRSGGLWADHPGPDVRMPFVVTYVTADPWPSSLPGVAA